MKKALVVGINNYPGSTRLRGCVNDATQIAHLLGTHADSFPNFDVMLALDVSDRPSLRKLITDLFKGEDDTNLFYFSGHGSITHTGGYIITPDFKQYDEGISMDEILVIANQSPARNKIVILDCCHSGAMGLPALGSNTAAYLEKGVMILAASRSTESAIEIGGQGVFTSLLLDALKGGAADISGEITPGGIYSYIDKALGSWEQRPVFKANIVRHISMRTVAPRLPFAELRKLIEYFPSTDFEFPLDPSFEYTTEAPNEENIEIFKTLRRMQVLGLLKPVDEEYMYWAALNNGSCRLTPLGVYYWQLITNGRI